MAVEEIWESVMADCVRKKLKNRTIRNLEIQNFKFLEKRKNNLYFDIVFIVYVLVIALLGRSKRRSPSDHTQ